MKKLTIRAWLNVGLAITLLAACVGVAQVFIGDGASASTLRTSNVTRATVTSSLSASGNVESATTVDISFQAAGQLTEVDVKPGDTVIKGQVLAKMDNAAQQAALDSATATLAQAQASLSELQSGPTAADDAKNDLTALQDEQNVTDAENEYNAAVAKGDDSATASALAGLNIARAQQTSNAATAAEAAKVKPADLAMARAAVSTAEAGVTSAQKSLDQTTLVAPADGTLTAVNNVVGDMVSGGSSSSGSASTSAASTTGATSTAASTTGSGSSFASLVDLNALRIKAGFTETDVAKLKVGQKATVTFDALTNTTAAATVSAIDTTATVASNVVTYYVTVDLTQAVAGVKPGMTSTVQVTVDSRSNVLSLPTAAVTAMGAGTTGTVTVMEGENQVTKSVTIGLKGDDSTEIVNGLTEGQSVVLATVTANASSSPASSARAGAGFSGGLTGGGVPAGGPPGGGF